MFEHSHEPGAIFSPVFDHHNRIVDALIHEANTAMAQAAGIPLRSLRGRLVSQLAGSKELSCSGCETLFKQINEAARKGRLSSRKGALSESVLAEGILSAFNRDYRYRVIPLDGDVLALLASDITTQRALERSEAQAMRAAFQVEMQHLLIETREKERLSIATQLHEGLLQALLGLRYAIEEGLGIDQKETRLARMALVQATLQREIQNLRDYCNELRPSTLSPFGLEKTIRAVIEAYQKRNPFPRIVMDLAPDRLAIPDQARQMLYNAFRELFKQAVAKPGTEQVTVRFTFNSEEACLEIAEHHPPTPGDVEGENRAPENWMEMARQGKLGLAAALQRVEGAGGTAQISTGAGQAHTTRITLPLRSVIPPANSI